MKKFIFNMIIAVSLLLASGCSDSEPKNRADTKNMINAEMVPPAVQKAFTDKYPTVTQVIWEKAHEGDMDTYKVKFKKRNEYLKAEYQPDGTLIKAEMDE